MSMGTTGKDGGETVNGLEINLDTLDVEEKKDRIFFGEMQYDMGIFPDNFGGGGQIHGSLGLVLPEEAFRPYSDESKERAIEFLSKWLENHHFSFWTRAETNQRLRCAVELMTCLIEGDPGEKTHLAMTAMILKSILLDDVQQDTTLFTTTSGSESCQGYDILRPIMASLWEGKYKNYEDLPRLEIPMLQPYLVFSFLSYELLSGMGKNIVAYEWVRKEKENARKGFVEMANGEFVNQLSEQSYFVLRIYDFAFLSAQEMQAALLGVTLTEQIRSNLIFQRLRQAFCLSCALVNDLLGFRRELDEVSPMNLVIRKVNCGLSLIEAVAQVEALIKSEQIDFQKCASHLMKRYSEDQDLAKYIHMMRYTMVGHVHVYQTPANLSKYGLTKFIVKYY